MGLPVDAKSWVVGPVIQGDMLIAATISCADHDTLVDGQHALQARRNAVTSEAAVLD